jgi:poly(hydroxyalkanoate) depolymerase family esterase
VPHLGKILGGKAAGNLFSQSPKWRDLMPNGTTLNGFGPGHHAPPGGLREVNPTGSNPGALRMFKHLPAGLPDRSPLVVVLHGCLQTASGYEYGSGWSTLADRYGFALLVPEQQRANNPNTCFNWFLPGDTSRGQGEALSIRQMVEQMVVEHGLDPKRIYVTGLSAGGAMTSAMLAAYPDIFAGGAIVAGLPYGAATNAQEAFQSMLQSPARPARVWGDLVRKASKHTGAWPRVSVWHGGADPTVIPANAQEIVKQWVDVHGLSVTPTRRDTVDGYPREVWQDTRGDDVIESYTIPRMAHGTPLAAGVADDQCGAPGAYLLEVGISSSYHIAKFWGLVGTPRAASIKTERATAAEAESIHTSAGPEAWKMPHATDMRSVITNALKAAGLMKG